jgi:hypothetical protein
MNDTAREVLPPVRRRRPATGLVVLLGVLVLLTLLGTRCIPHPVGATRSYSKYESKARTTAKSALSNVETVRLAAQTATKGNAFGPYLSVLISDAEEAISGVQGTFDSIQPPNEEADKLQQDLDPLLSDALDHVRDVRVAVRRGELSDLDDQAQPLDDDAQKLGQFQEQHS